jgi:hypothetical protein
VIATSAGEVAVYKLNCTVLTKYFECVQSMWPHLTDGNSTDITIGCGAGKATLPKRDKKCLKGKN